MIEMMVYTLVGIALYVGADKILLKIEESKGQKFEHRDMVFFAIILILALFTFAVIRVLVPDL
ncbi:MAG: hypothetical protein HN764_14630 [Gammaproteobacteria bacterium]|jgi:hypothetical protein|nr:hypothetical protein [Gammaproteobacteria bacterium]